MTMVCTKVVIGGLAGLVLSACQVSKSENPLSPSVAGPVKGVVISTPSLLEPGQDWEMKTRDQPLKMLFQNAGTNGVRPLKYSFDIATDAEFKNIVFTRSGIEPAPGATTTFQLPDKLAAGTYWWRSKAEDGANSGAYSAAISFQVLAEVILAPPIPSSPGNGSTVPDLTPEFRIRAGNRSGVTAPIDYVLQVANNSSFTSIAATFTQGETWPETTIGGGYSFLHSKTYFWRVRAWHTGDGSDLSNWSSTMNFKTPAPPAGPPPPDPPGGGGGGGGGGNPGACNSNDGDDIAECIEARYPQYRKGGVSLSKRYADMAFLRDRMIEHAKCKGLLVGRNDKRGKGTEISRDFITYFTGGRWVGVDIASGYDDTSRTLNLMWLQYGPPDYGFPYPIQWGSCK